MDFDLIREVRNVWQFFRDRRPETYGAITRCSAAQRRGAQPGASAPGFEVALSPSERAAATGDMIV